MPKTVLQQTYQAVLPPSPPSAWHSLRYRSMSRRCPITHGCRRVIQQSGPLTSRARRRLQMPCCQQSSSAQLLLFRASQRSNSRPQQHRDTYQALPLNRSSHLRMLQRSHWTAEGSQVCYCRQTAKTWDHAPSVGMPTQRRQSLPRQPTHEASCPSASAAGKATWRPLHRQLRGIRHQMRQPQTAPLFRWTGAAEADGQHKTASRRPFRLGSRPLQNLLPRQLASAQRSNIHSSAELSSRCISLVTVGGLLSNDQQKRHPSVHSLCLNASNREPCPHTSFSHYDHRPVTNPDWELVCRPSPSISPGMSFGRKPNLSLEVMRTLTLLLCLLQTNRQRRPRGMKQRRSLRHGLHCISKSLRRSQEWSRHCRLR